MMTMTITIDNSMSRPKTGGDEFYANTEVLINRNMDISVYTLTLIGPTFSFAVWMLALVTTRHN